MGLKRRTRKSTFTRPLRTTIREVDSETGMVYLREAVTVAFFLPTPIHKIVTPLRAACDEYFEMIPRDALRWASVGANSETWKPFGSRTLASCRAQLSPKLTQKRSLTAFELKDTGPYLHDTLVVADAPTHGIEVIGNPVDPAHPNGLSLMQMRFPSEMVEADVVETFVDNVCRMASLLPVVSGYASPGLQFSEYAGHSARSRSWDILPRYPGYDVQRNEACRNRLGARVRGARWLTFIGPEIITALGDANALRQTLGAQIEIRSTGQSLMIRAGRVPEIGDTLRNVGTPLLSAVAIALRPVTAFKEVAMRAIFARDDEFHDAWEGRFW